MTILNKEKILETARALIEEGKFDRAIREYEKILLADPGDTRVKLRIAELSTKRKQITEAIRLYREVAEAYAAEGFFLKAVTVHKNILRLNPSLTEINEQLALLYEKMGLIADAIRQYDILASALDLRGQAERVLEIRNRIVMLAPKDGAARIKLAEVCQREGKMEEAIDQYEELARQIEGSGGEPSRLADLFEKILAHRPDNHEMLRKLVQIYTGMGDQKKALKCLENSRQLVERDPELLAMMARIYASQHQSETARSTYLLLAELEAEAGRIEQALDAYGEILVLLPGEEDRLARRIEELSPDALPALVERAHERRKELEREEHRKQQAEAAKEALREVEEKAAREVERKRKREGPKAAPAVQSRPPVPRKKSAAEEKPLAAPPAAPAPAPKERVVTPDRRPADAAFDLGIVYRQMGLSEEAAVEFAKAREIYRACLEAGSPDPDVAGRLAQIEAAAAGKSAMGARDEGRGTRDEGRRTRDEKELGKKKKRVSFV